MKARVAVSSRWWDSAAEEGLSVPPARETGTSVVGFTEGMSPVDAGDVDSGAAAVSEAMEEVAMSTTGTSLD